MHLYGKVEIYLNKTDVDSIQTFNKSKIDYTKFAMKGQYMNRLLLTNKDKELYCKNCYYIVAVVAEKLTESTLFYSD